MQKHLLPKWKDKRLCDITESEIEKWILELKEKGLSNKTINNISSVFSVMLKQAYNSRLIERNIEIPRLATTPYKREILTEDEFAKLFGKNEKIWSDETVKLFCLTSALTGARRGELRALERNDIKENYLVISKSYSEVTSSVTATKSTYARIVPLSSQITDKLLLISGNDLVFESTKGNALNAERISREFARALCNIGLTKAEIKRRHLTLHSLRHFANTRFVLKGIKGEIIREVIGHRSEEMTRHYTSLNLENRTEYEGIIATQNELIALL